MLDRIAGNGLPAYSPCTAPFSRLDPFGVVGGATQNGCDSRRKGKDMGLLVTVAGSAVFFALAFTLIGGPMVLVDWSRKRRETVIARQIALTDALDGRFGAIVAPVVTRSLFGSWEVRIAVPFLQSAVLSQMLSVIDGVFADGGPTPSRAYRIALTVARDGRCAGPEHKARGREADWAQAPGYTA